ncbi:site-2 protease family protein [Clostridium chauvoei]|uniref:site-2 protease family protein n=1 Tax=Clostridium chauvoei TaxID=46867 RepID=UPI001C85DF1C|nr:site-2 protease family protein [Clostridium chauvoei]MBX7310134.1 site-2 protease family protein [Clostridium chauvoei]MBX7315021.1 site-2 protease family protein [Clostridium chauvoei]MBX7343030.1 site-2 protease family protein [Clostridium chauvoei]
MRNYLLKIILTVPAILVAFTVQGYARALVADKLGDKTPRFQGRLTLNPAAHIDPLGFIMILLVHFGWTKPVDTNPSAYKRGYKDSIKVSIAAPLGNLITGFIFAFIWALWSNMFKSMSSEFCEIGGRMLFYVCIINVNLFIFNLLPLPGLAGFDILRDLWPKTYYKVADTIYQYQLLILLGVVLVASEIISIPSTLICSLFTKIAFSVVGIFF